VTQTNLCNGSLNAADVMRVTRELVRAMINSEVLGIADINHPIIAAPAVRMEHGVERDSTTNYSLQRKFRQSGMIFV
jgi:hypothetical protein